ncbi:sugar kinase [Paenibacillus crassostreae]|uniref:2-dehydro-3-deoxygluconokinase n=1 Tax=Paenibacillus crassostreae TaxID=1763538 RepID=A0A167GLW1_9BACL|nr:sugar kinase [Paenibacillus crassostreae]AOZ92236.1 2-dehydro-3-deoxygluconokinase [Paenibacillus crassostreae]OAB77699.1 2-dehydro-3-deoxygluconokinase [Paenibacillus crassostreae]
MNNHLDVVTFGEPMAMFYANEPGPLHEIFSFSKALAGAETNVAVGLSRLGLNAGLVTKLGEDNFGKFIVEALKKEKIDTRSMTFTEQYSTGMLVKSKVITGDPIVEYFRKSSAASKLNVSDFDADYFSSARHMHMTSISVALSQECHEFAVHAMKFMKDKDKTISFDPNLRPKLWPDTSTMVKTINDLSSNCDWFLPGINEGRILTGYETPEDIASFYLDRGISVVVIKLGAEGAYYQTVEQAGYVKGFPVTHVVDTVGAGDGFAVGVISALLDGLSLEEATRRGNAIGALAVMSPGDMDGLPTRDKLESFMK